MADLQFTAKRVDTNPIYQLWLNMNRRCSCESSPDFERYGGRGISVCDRWANSFESFKEDVLPSWSPGLTLDRIDNNRGYSPDNVKWSTRTEQANNRRSNRLFTINGLTKTFAQWIKESGVKSSTARQRFYVYGWSIEKALGMEAQIG